MMTVNTVAVTGRVAGTPEIRQERETHIAEIDLVLSETRKISDLDDDRWGEWVTVEQSLPVTVWGKQAEACAEYLQEGTPVAVQGRLTGDGHGELRVIAAIVQFLAPTREAVAA